MQNESAIPSFLNSLPAAGIELPPGVELLAGDASVRPEDPAVPRGRGAHPPGVQAGDRASAGCGTSAVLRGVDPAWLGDSVNFGASSSVHSAADPPVRMVSFAESVDRAEDDNTSVTSEKLPPQEGLSAVLRQVVPTLSFCSLRFRCIHRGLAILKGCLLRSPRLVWRNLLWWYFIVL